jgi:hypothetical protein
MKEEDEAKRKRRNERYKELNKKREKKRQRLKPQSTNKYITCKNKQNYQINTMHGT